jgi:hypothetical protein
VTPSNFVNEGLQPRLRVRRLMSMPPRLKPRTAPNSAAVIMMPGDEPGVVRENRTAVYASERVQKASRKYMGEPADEIISQPATECHSKGKTSINVQNGVGGRMSNLVTGAGRLWLEDKP